MSERAQNKSAPKFVVEAQAFTAMTFYAENYVSFTFRDLDPNSGKEALDDKPPGCRFCGRSKPAATISKDAHVISVFVGSKLLFSRYVSDDYNSRFSELDDDLGEVDKIGSVSGGGEVDHAEEAAGKLVVTRGDGAVDLEVAEHALDAVALLVECPVMLDLHQAV